MSFGFGVGDAIQITEICWTVYKRCKESPGLYKQLAGEVSSLHSVLKETEELVRQQKLCRRQKERLRPCYKGCETVLNDLTTVLTKYESLGTSSRRAFDRMGMATEDINEIRQRLITNVTMLNAFIGTFSNARLERRMNLLITEVRAGKREGSVISTQGFEEAAETDQSTWYALQRDLEDVGVSAEAIEENKPMIINWFREAVAAGKLEEDDPLWDDGSTLNLGDSASLSEKEEAGPVRVGSNDSVMKRAMMVFRRTSSSGALSSDVDVQKSGMHTGSSTPPTHTYDEKDSRLSVSYLLSRLQGRNIALLEAAKANDESQIRTLLAKGAKVGEVDQLGETALHIAAAVSTDGKTVQTLLDSGVDVNLIGTEGVMSQTPLISACRNHAVDTARILLQHGADPNINCNGTAISYAAMHGNLGVVQLLLEHGVDVEAPWRDKTVLHFAAGRPDVAIVRLLLDHGADIHARSPQGLTALGIAAGKHGGEGVIQVLLDKGSDIEDKFSNKSETPLHRAARDGILDNVRALLDRGAHIDVRNSSGETPLMKVVQNKQIHSSDIVRLLLRKGADARAADIQGHTVLFWAKQNPSNNEVIQLLYNWGAEEESSQPYPGTSHYTLQPNDEQHPQIYDLPHRGIETSGQSAPQPYYQRYNQPYGGVT